MLSNKFWQLENKQHFLPLALARYGGKEVQSSTITSRVLSIQFYFRKTCKKLCQKRAAFKLCGFYKIRSLGVCFLKRREKISALLGLPLIELCSFCKECSTVCVRNKVFKATTNQIMKFSVNLSKRFSSP